VGNFWGITRAESAFLACRKSQAFRPACPLARGSKSRFPVLTAQENHSPSVSRRERPRDSSPLPPSCSLPVLRWGRASPRPCWNLAAILPSERIPVRALAAPIVGVRGSLHLLAVAPNFARFRPQEYTASSA